MNGRELATQITAKLPDVRVLYMSGYTENAVGHDGLLDAGINLLQKPFSLPILKDKVRELAGFRTDSSGGRDAAKQRYRCPC
jgi:two-component system, cell cycle sensor histidine kinase and response regulator CckA